MLKWISKFGKKHYRLVPEGVSGGFLGVPWGLPEASRESAGTVFETRRRSMKNLRRLGRVPEPILGPSQTRLGPQNRQKTHLCPKRRPRKAPPEAFFANFECHCCFGSLSGPKIIVFRWCFLPFLADKKCTLRNERGCFA